MAINIGMNLRILPVVGIPLPFISYGGSSLLTLYILLGIREKLKEIERERKNSEECNEGYFFDSREITYFIENCLILQLFCDLFILILNFALLIIFLPAISKTCKYDGLCGLLIKKILNLGVFA